MKRIALVEDNPDNRLLIEAILDGTYDLDAYENGPDALAGMAARAPDLALVDISLPRMDGLEVLRRMRADERLKGVPAVALTAHAMNGDRERFLSAGFSDYVTKPIMDDALLLDAIRRGLGE
ncbi:MAG: response regulator [Planctomycetota bacterium]|nr:response regulator [Planctomycetota bacterium]